MLSKSIDGMPNQKTLQLVDISVNRHLNSIAGHVFRPFDHIAVDQECIWLASGQLRSGPIFGRVDFWFGTSASNPDSSPHDHQGMFNSCLDAVQIL
jgi:hypothetical protein